VSSLLRQFGEAQLRVAGTSMLPAIRPADILFVRQVDITRVTLGDIAWWNGLPARTSQS
jgi:signal peptidase I